MSEVKGLKELISTLQKIPKELDKEVDKTVFGIAQEIEADAKILAPVGTPESTGKKKYIGGSLQQSIKAIKQDNKTYMIKANATGLAPYAAFVEHGTYKMRAQPFLFPAFFKGRQKFIEDLQALLKDKFNKA